MRIIRHLVLGFTGSIVLLGASVAAVLAFPQPLFAYHAERGALQLWSDQPFDAAKAYDVLADAERRIARSPLALGVGPHRVFIANAEWRRRLMFLWNSGAGGVNYYPLRNVFIRHADVDGDRVFGNTGAVPPPRTLAYFAAHEVGHSLRMPLAHSKYGLRRGNWEPALLRRNLPRDWTFSPDDAARVRRAPVARANASPDVILAEHTTTADGPDSTDF